MNLDDKHDLDAMLRRWPAPPPSGDEPDEDKRWEQRADATVRAAVESTRHGGPDDGLDALLAAPVLAPEPGESAATFRSGDKDPTPMPLSKPPPPTERKRGSLKEIAARASQSGARPSQPGMPAGTPMPASNPTPIPMAVGRPSRPPLSTPVPGSTSRPLSRPPEAGKEDSGVVNLHEVRAAATPAQIAAAEKAKPGQVGIFDDETVESATNSAEQPAPARPTNVTVIAARKNRTGPIAGAAIALLGIAAAFAIMQRKPPSDTAPPTPVIAARTAPEAAKQAPSTAPKTTAGPAPLDIDALPNANEGKPSDTAKVAVGPAPGLSGAAAGASASKDAQPEPKVAAKGPGDKPDLASEMAKAVGPGDKSGQPAATAEPAAADNRNQSIPEQPSQGSVQSAIGAVIGSAKACVTGADDISRATVTFSSAGTVSSVSVSGWAAAHGKSGCVEAALKAAKVGAFSKPSYSVPVPIRP